MADTIPTELRRLVEFLNEQMINAEVLAVEVKQFLGEGQKAIVPRLIGMTETARENKQQSNRKPTTRDEFLAKCAPEIANIFGHILDIAKERGHTVYWGKVGFSIRVYLPETESLASIAYGFPPDLFQIYFGHLPWPEEQISALRKELLALNIFREAPKTLSANLDSKSLQKANEAYELTLNSIGTLATKKPRNNHH